MTHKEPKQPIPLYPTATVAPGPGPEPLKFPKPALTDEQLRNLVASYVARVLHKTALRLSEAEIVTMTEQEFEAFCRKVLEEE